MEKPSKIRNLQSLKIKIGEAKNLAGKSSCSGTTSNRDVYCTVALDQEEICRTQTERTSCPFFGEEFQFEIPRKFRYLSVYVMERDKHLKQDKPVGKIAIRKEELHVYNHKDHWFPLRPVDEDSEVQGMAQIEVNILDGPILKGNRNEDHLKENFNKNPSTNNYTTTLIPSSSTHRTVQAQNTSTLQMPVSAGPIVSATSTANANHKAPKLLYSTTVSHTPSTQQINLEKSNSHQDISVINSNFNHNVLKQSTFSRVTYPFQQQHNTMIHLQSHHEQRIQIKLIQCRDLTKKNNSCDPYAIVTAIYSNKRKLARRSKVRKKTINPQFDEVFEFNLHDMLGSSNCNSGNNSDSSSSKIYTIAPLGGNDLCEIQITIWHDPPGMSDKVFLGEVRLPVRGKQQLNALQQNAWYFLLPRQTQSRPVRSCATPPGTRLSCENSLGSLRLKLHYNADLVFPLATYDNLLNVLIQSVDQLPITTSAVYLLGELVANKQEIAQPLVRLFTYNNLIVPIINRLAENEISKLTDPTTIFRGNTLVSKMMDEAMKLSGLHYLHSTLRPIVELILHEKKPCEIDPARVKEKESIEQNLINLHEYVGKVFDAIMRSASRCPQVLCQIFHDLRETATKYFPMNKEVRYSVVSGFIFLRFFAPAILGPKLFDLTSEPLDMQTSRTLTLISKTIQSLGNLVSSRSAQQPCKEQYTEELYKKFCTEKHVEAVKNFLEAISTPEDQRALLEPQEKIETEPILLKEGMMTKRAQGRKRFGRRNFKQRYFRLTTQSLSYAKTKGKRPICDIPLTDLIAVERLEERSFKMQNIFRIVRKERPLYVQTTNCVEEKHWVDLLSKICENNKKRQEFYHNCAYINGEWTCCNQTDQSARGCKSMADKPFEMELVTQLDPARDLQRIHSLIISNISSIEKYFDSSNAEANNEEMMMCRKTIQKLTDFSMQLEQIHRKYKHNLLRETKYGSLLQPIGDDNYLRGGLSVQIAQQLNASGNNTGNSFTSAASFLSSGSSTTPRHQTNATYDYSPNFFPRNHFLRSSDSERFSHF